MRIEAQLLSGVHLFIAEPIADERGSFARTFDAPLLALLGLETAFPQRAIAANTRAGTIRGLHYAAEPHAEAKIITCLRGELFDVIVDLRPASPTFGHWSTFGLDARTCTSLYVPRGFAHGYQTLVDETLVAYDLSACYVAAAARGVRYDDPGLGIAWPLAVTSISARDAQLPSIDELRLHGDDAIRVAQREAQHVKDA
jgi:dTDP-4-dehydrorhamnose 3,5-epimerase